jgi:hypothetical protein
MEVQRVKHECFVNDRVTIQFAQIKIPGSDGNDHYYISFISFNEEADDRFTVYVSIKAILVYISQHLSIDMAKLRRMQSEFFIKRNDVKLFKTLLNEYELEPPKTAPDLPTNLLLANLMSVQIFMMEVIDVFSSKCLSDLLDLLLDYYMNLTPLKHNMLEKAKLEDDEEGDKESVSTTSLMEDKELRNEDFRTLCKRHTNSRSSVPYKLQYLTDSYYDVVDMYPELALERNQVFVELGISINQLKFLDYRVCKKEYDLFIHTHLLRLKIFVCSIDVNRVANASVLRTAIRHMKNELINAYEALDNLRNE